jgi:PAS domain-containing protein
VEQHVESADDAKSYIMRILPYRTVENVIAGVVVTFVDITRITAAEAEVAALTHELRNRVESLERILDLVPVGILIGGVDTMQHVQINRYVARLLGEKTDIRGPRDISIPYRLFDHKRELPFWEQPLQRAVFTGQAVPAVEGRLVRSDGKSMEVLMSAEPLFDERGKPRGAISTIVGIPERKKGRSRLGHVTARSGFDRFIAKRLPPITVTIISGNGVSCEGSFGECRIQILWNSGASAEWPLVAFSHAAISAISGCANDLRRDHSHH